MRLSIDTEYYLVRIIIMLGCKCVLKTPALDLVPVISLVNKA
ncbi:hypothetical protein [Candidatus Vallotia tarda]|nr:hypothetical protein [Candidatus Vallotia tarda]